MANNIKLQFTAANELYVTVALPNGGALSYRFQRGIGGSSTSDTGAPYADWRRTGEYFLTSDQADPRGPRTVIGEGVGAFDYAFYSHPNAAWGGSYHGGETVKELSGSIVTGALIDGAFDFTRKSQIRYKNGDTINVTLHDRINPDGNFTESITASSAMRITTRYIGMEVGNGVGWTQISTDGGAHFYSIGSVSSYVIGRVSDVIMRNSDSGLTINVVSDAAQSSEFLDTEILKNGTNWKLYYNFGGGVLNGQTISKTTNFGSPASNTVVHITSAETYTLTALETHLTLLGAAAINGTGNTRDNTITGNGAANILSGLRGQDSLVGAGGDDSLRGGAGDDLIDGGSGIDTAVFSGQRADYAFSADKGAIIVRHLIADGDGIDTLTNVEKLAFADGTIAGSFLWLSDGSTVEGDTGEVMMAYTVSLLGSASQAVTVAYSTADGTAAAASDYEAASGTLTFSVGETSKQILVRVFGDRSFEADETFSLHLSAPGNAQILNGSASGTIVNDDPNGLPQLTDDVLEVLTGGTLDVGVAELLVNDSDPEGGPLALVSVQDAVNGTVLLDSGRVIFTPTAGYWGPASFTYSALDSAGGLATAGVGVIVSPPLFSAPVGFDDGYSVSEDASLVVDASNGLLVNDARSGTNDLAAVLVQEPTHGVLALNPDGSFTYTPNADFHGNDQFVYRPMGNGLVGDPAVVHVTVDPVNDTPAAADDGVFTTAYGAPIVMAAADLLANDTDLDGDALTIAAVGEAVGGTVVLADGVVIFTPDAGYWGSASYSYTISDLAGAHATAQVDLVIAPPPPPAAVDDAYAVDEDQLLQVGAVAGLLANDSYAGGPLSVALIEGPKHGTLTLDADGSFRYHANADYNGEDSFSYYPAGGAVSGAPAIVRITVNSVNDAPTATADGIFATAFQTAITKSAANLLANDRDVDGDALSIVAVGNAANGVVTLNNGSVTFTPKANFSGSASYQYTLSDGQGGTSVTSVTVIVDQPVRNDIFSSTAADEFFDGGPGNDTVTYDKLKSGVTVSLLRTDAQATGAGGHDALLSIENLTGTAYNDILTGDAGVNRLTGGNGDDSLDGGAGADVLVGGLGNDLYLIDDVGDLISSESGGTDKVYSTVSYILDVSLEELILTGTADINGTGSKMNDRIGGNSGNNVISGGWGYDTLVGGEGNDIMLGGGDRDTIDGGNGNDVVDGGSGIDWIRGGNGIDRFVFQSAADGNGDEVQDFRRGDTLDFSAFGSGLGASLRFAGAGDFSGAAGEIRSKMISTYVYQAMVDLNGDAKADMVLMLYTDHAPVKADFIL